MSIAMTSTSDIEQITQFIRNTVRAAGKQQVIVAVSGGIDSAVSLQLAVEALGPQAVTAVLLPYGQQSMTLALQVTQQAGLMAEQILEIKIDAMVEAGKKTLNLDQAVSADRLRLGNLQARARMIVTFDLAKKLDALVCGTENKSEKYLGYFTRFGDEASDLEPLQHLYKTQVRQLAQELQLPQAVLDQAPSAGLWHGQTDEAELGFSYQDADQVLAVLVDQLHLDFDRFQPELVPDVEAAVATKVIARVKSQRYKLEVPFGL